MSLRFSRYGWRGISGSGIADSMLSVSKAVFAILGIGRLRPLTWTDVWFPHWFGICQILSTIMFPALG